ncbi:MAG: hypothetical protein GY943_09855 [Chloroflexi bacterium]|nr:hypothetical protein [Chloroflexota bacterium]
MNSGQSKAKLGNLFILLISFLVAIAIGEIFLRIAGQAPWYYAVPIQNQPTMFEPHSKLGWVMKTGQYTAYTPDATPLTINFLPNATRATGNSTQTDLAQIAVVGGSYTHGWLISDDETYAWKLQTMLPSTKVINFGTPGYGTYQSLLVLEDYFSTSPPTSIVIYGFIEHHENRNVATAEWLDTLMRSSSGKQGEIPYTDLDDAGNLVRHPLTSYPEWPLKEHSVTITILERLYSNVVTMERSNQKRAVTEALLLEMQALAAQSGAQFAVVFLKATDDTAVHYQTFASANDMHFIDCLFPIPPDKRVPLDGHPNGDMNTIWADCIETAVSPLLETAN